MDDGELHLVRGMDYNDSTIAPAWNTHGVSPVDGILVLEARMSNSRVTIPMDASTSRWRATFSIPAEITAAIEGCFSVRIRLADGTFLNSSGSIVIHER